MGQHVTTTSVANSIREKYQPGFLELVYRNDQLFPLFPPMFDPGGDTNFRWKVNSAGNDSVEIFTEGGAQPPAGYQAITNAAVAWTYFRGMLQITGHARDALKSRWINHIDEEMTLLMGDLVDLMTTSFMGGTYGLELAVDYGSAYAGITRNGAAGYFEATETAVNDSLTTDDLIDLREVIMDNDKGGRPGLILCSHNQVSNIYRLGGPHVIHNSNPADKAPGIGAQTFAGVPVVGLGDWSNTVIMMLDMRPGKWAVPQIRPFSVKEMAPSGDSDVLQVSWGGSLIDKAPKFDGKITGVTA